LSDGRHRYCSSRYRDKRWRGVNFRGGHSPLRDDPAASRERGRFRRAARRCFGSRSACRPPAPSGVQVGERPIAPAEGAAAGGLSGGGVGAIDAAGVEEPGAAGPAVQTEFNSFI